MTTPGRAKKSVRVRLVVLAVFSLLVGTVSTVLPQEASAATVSDNFDRADGGLGGNWTTVAGTSAPRIVSNTLRAGTARALNSAYWSASTFGADQFAQASLPDSSGTQYGPGIAVRLSGTQGYFLWYGNSPGTVSLWRMDGSSSSSWTQLAQSAPLTMSPSSDVWMIQAVGSTISGYQNGNLVVQATDTHITSGSPGVWLYYSSNQIDNWSGGDVTTYQVGGTVSGLSGTVVLQDNGGDDLSVSASGGFTFATALSAGSAYNVTVKANPAGQTCSVANGSGTVGSSGVTNIAVTCAANSSSVVSDNFDRADGGLGGNWTTVAGTSAPRIVSNTLRAGTAGALNSAYWSASTFGADQFAQASLPDSSGTQYGPGIAVRLSGTQGYFLWYGNSPGTVSLWRMDGSSSSSWTQLAQSAPLTMSPSSDVWMIQAVGSTISGYQNGNLVVQATDTHITSGSPGVWLYYSSNQIDNWSGGDVTTYQVGGTVSGLSGTVVLQDNGGDDLSVSASGGFTFATALSAGSAYNVTVKANPAGQTCSVANGSGTVGSSGVTNIAVTCAANSSSVVSDNFDRADGGLGGNWTTVAGTSAPRIVSNTLRAGTAGALNSAYWSASTFGADQFAQASLPDSSGTQYGPGIAVRLSGTQGYFLWYGNSPGTVSLWRMDGSSSSSWTQLAQSAPLTMSPSSDVWMIQAVGSTISGYQNGNLVVQATDTHITSGSPGVWLYYSSNQIDNWSGGNVTTYRVGGTVSGLSGTVVLQDNGGDDLSVSASGGFTFATALSAGSAYNVTVKTSPAGQTCSVANGSGTVGSSGVTNIAVTCAAAATYRVGGTVSGLSGTVVLQDNGGDDLSVSASGGFTFATALSAGSAYNVTVKTSPAGQTCSVANGSGTVGSSDVTNIAVTCTTSACGQRL